MNSVKLRVFKEKFKFSAAHFLIFDEKRAERLHGHNYRVRLDIQAYPEAISRDRGFLLDFGKIKAVLAKELEQWDEMVLLPGKHPDMKFQEDKGGLQVHFRDRYYAFPRAEVVILPIFNTSVEALSELLAHRLAEQFSKIEYNSISVEVEESPGQAASYLLFKTQE